MAPDGAKLLYASVVPYDLAEPAARLARELGVPWVADLQDPWALDETWLYPDARLIARSTAAHAPAARDRGCDRHEHARGEDSAPGELPGAEDAARRVHPERVRRVRLLVEPESRDHAKFRIVHTGYLHTDQGLRLREMRAGESFSAECSTRSTSSRARTSFCSRRSPTHRCRSVTRLEDRGRPGGHDFGG